MEYRQWMFCNECDRTFVLFLNEKPDEGRIDLMTDNSFRANAEMQFGVDRWIFPEDEYGAVYAECPYEGCTRSPMHWQTWERFRRNHSWAPEVPEEDTVYPLFPLDGQE